MVLNAPSLPFLSFSQSWLYYLLPLTRHWRRGKHRMGDAVIFKPVHEIPIAYSMEHIPHRFPVAMWHPPIPYGRQSIMNASSPSGKGSLLLGSALLAPSQPSAKPFSKSPHVSGVQHPFLCSQTVFFSSPSARLPVSLSLWIIHISPRCSMSS